MSDVMAGGYLDITSGWRRGLSPSLLHPLYYSLLLGDAEGLDHPPILIKRNSVWGGEIRDRRKTELYKCGFIDINALYLYTQHL
jgi:hypothetical protein